MKQNPGLHSNLAILPGEYLSEVLERRSMSQADLARRMGRPPQAINEIIRGEKAITPDTALQLEEVLGVPAAIWMGLEGEYQLTLARLQEEGQLIEETVLLEQIPFNEMVKQGWVNKLRTPTEKVRELRKFFGVASLNNIGGVHAYAPAFRKAKQQASPYAQAAWLRQGEIEAEKMTLGPLNLQRLREKLADIRAMTRLLPNVFLENLKQLLADCGVALVLLPHLPKTYVNGATFWTASGKPVLQMTIRGKWADIFWFSLFHEIGHLLLHGKKEVFLENASDHDPERLILEDEADVFAQHTLIPKEEFRRFASIGDFEIEAIRRFADKVGVSAGIIVGRLHHNASIHPSQLNHLRVRYEWA